MNKKLFKLEMEVFDYSFGYGIVKEVKSKNYNQPLPIKVHYPKIDRVEFYTEDVARGKGLPPVLSVLNYELSGFVQVPPIPIMSDVRDWFRENNIEVYTRDREVFLNRNYSEAFKALNELTFISEYYNERKTPQFNKYYPEKICNLSVSKDESETIIIDVEHYRNSILSFPDRETAELFKEEQKELILKAKILL